jgi:predicted patatin/cPLA2 family phospholipase
VPGLENVLKQVRNPGAAVTAPEKGTGTQADAPMCNIETMTLISTDIAPNSYGDDLANIDMAISGAALETFAESVTAVEQANVSTAAFGFARSVTAQNIVVKAMESVDAFEQMLSNTMSLQDDYAVSDTINAQLMAARAESASLMTALVSMKAAQDLNAEVMSPIPLFPQNSRFEEVVEEKLSKQRKKELEKAREMKKVAQDHSQFMRKARQATKNYNAVTNAISVAESMPEVKSIIQDHESLKTMQLKLEEVIKSRLAQLYEDPASAWETLREDLYQEAGSYLDSERYEEGFRDATRISQEVTATRTQTDYGRRKYTVSEDRDGDRKWHYARATETPYAYDFIDPNGAPLQDPYVRSGHGIRPRSVLLREDDDDRSYMPYGYEMVGALQYYLEIVRRTQFYSELRRGDATASMSSRFWTELITNASHCIIGPIELTETNLIRRPDMFDLSPDCDHLTWSLGDAGDYISASELGGADAALWISKITLDRTQQRTGGPDKVLQEIQEVIAYAKKHDLMDRLKTQSLASSMTQTGGVLGLLEQALGDGTFSAEIEFPRLSR